MPFRNPYTMLFGKSGRVAVYTGQRKGVGQSDENIPDPPPDWPGTLPEWAIFWAHTQLGRNPGIDFVYQYQVGDPASSGSAKLDFYEVDLNMGINVNGLFYHYGLGGYKITSDREQKFRLESLGIQMLAIDEGDAIRGPVYFLQEALSGKDHSILGHGYF